MKKTQFNGGWSFRKAGGEWRPVELPHDAMLGEKRSPDSAGGVNVCWFEGGDYEYLKNFFIDESLRGKHVFFEFEGVYRNAQVFINDRLAAERPYGYTNFYVPADDFLNYGGDNVMRVVARNSDQPNSRWYSGAGIYRPVSMYVCEPEHILVDGLKVRTLSVSPAVVQVKVAASCAGTAFVALKREGRTVAEGSCECADEGSIEFSIEGAELWSPQSPALYECEAVFGRDRCSVKFGIRKIEWSAERGFVLNGERVILRGACIHHDNGILGARCYAEAEERKIKLLKSVGYNAVRSAHNPCSKALLDACDRLGMLVMDEYVDMWYIHKTRFDYADYAPDWYERDITDMIDKDYNHPCVIMYSLGNEVAETGQKRGIEFFKKMRDVCKKLDPDRPVTVGVNIFFNLLHSLGMGVYSDKKASSAPSKKVGSEFFNDLAGKLGAGFMKVMAKLHACDLKTRDCYAAMDVAGYNYGILRYEHDLKKYPRRIILGSETFCSDAYAFYECAKKHNALIGDFVWSGMDYLGEVGVGSWEYKNYAPDFSHGPGWMTAGSGRIDLVGNLLGEALYTRVAFGLEDRPQIAVVPVDSTFERHSPSAWKFSNALPSWSWNGLDGNRAKVEVYSRAPMVKLYINGRQVGSRRRGKNCRMDFTVKYEGGEICAVACDERGRELAANSLYTAGERTALSVLSEKSAVRRGEVCFIRLRFTDDNGVWKPLERGRISVEAEGGELLALGNACPYNEGGYLGTSTDTYYGNALAVVKAQKNRVRITARSGDLCGSAEISVTD